MFSVLFTYENLRSVFIVGSLLCYTVLCCAMLCYAVLFVVLVLRVFDFSLTLIPLLVVCDMLFVLGLSLRFHWEERVADLFNLNLFVS